MKHEYLSIGKKYIRTDIESILLYYDYFFPGVVLPTNINYRIIKIILHKLLKLLILIIFTFKISKSLFKVVWLEEDVVLFIEGEGKLKNIIKLVKKNNKYKIIKIVNDKGAYEQEKSFYNCYKSNHSAIHLPKCDFYSQNIIEMEFLKKKTFNRLILEGQLNLQQSLEHFLILKKQLQILYGEKSQLIHGDFCPINIFITKNDYYVIDFSDSQINSYKFDLYVLLYSILLAHQKISFGTKSLSNISIEKKLLLNLLDVDQNQFIVYENQYRKLREEYNQANAQL